MAISSINTNIAAQYALQNISAASSSTSSSVARLSSGNRIVQASDDVAGLSIGTSLQTQVSALNTALLNASQATSLLQVADGALAQIQTILQQQKSIALQAGSGSLTDVDRGFLNQQFQALSDQINNLTTSTTFNSVGLIDGSISQTVSLGSVSTAATQSSAALTFTTIAAGNTIIINGVTLTAAAAPGGAGQFQRGSDIATTVQNLANYLNGAQNDVSGNALAAADKLLVSGATYQASGDTLIITAKPGGTGFKFLAEDDAGGGGTAIYTSSGTGANSVSSLSAITATSLDVDVVTNAAGGLSAGVITLDGTTIATVAAGNTLREVVNLINADSDTTGAYAYVTGTTGAYVLNVRTLDDTTVGTLAGAATLTVTVDAQSVGDGAEVLSGGLNDGIGYGSVSASGSTGGATSILTDQSQTAATGGYNFNDIADGNLVSTLDGLNFVVAGVTFTFSTNTQTSTARNEIAIGSTLEETLDNAVDKINAFASDSDTNYQFNQFTAVRDGTRLTLEANVPGGVTDTAGATSTFTIGTLGTNATVFGSFAAPTNTGVDTKGVANADFIGSIGGLTATYVSANTVDLSITVGGSTYIAQNISTNPTSNTDVRLISTDGGYFDIQLRGSYGETLNSQAGADTFAARINAALEGLTFSQNRIVSSYEDGNGILRGSSVSYNSTDFDGVKVTDITVTAPTGSSENGVVSFIIGGEAYTADVELGGQIGANATIKFVSATDPNKYLTFTNGATALDISSASAATTLQSALRTAFGVGTGAEALSFQVGTTTSSTVKVSIEAANTANIFGGQSLSVATASDAANAASVLDTAIATVTAIRANVGALQTQFNFASASLQSSVQNQDAARSQLLDTDIAAESTKYATSQVKLQAGISVLAQANQQLQALLKLIG